MIDEKPLRKIIIDNKKIISKDFDEQIKIFESCVEKQRDIIFDYCTNVNFEYKVDKYSSLKGIVYKNSITLHATLELIKMGYHSSAAILLRNVFEGFLIIIQVERYNDKELYKKFRRNRTIEPHKAIQNNPKIPKKIKNEIKILWNFLCKKNHATTSTLQIAVDYNVETSNKLLSNKELTNQIFGIYGLFVDINWILTEQYIFDSFCRYIVEEKFKDERKYNKFKYKYNKTNNQSTYYRSIYYQNAIDLIDFIKDYNSEVELNMLTSKI